MKIIHTEEMGVIGGQSLRVLEDLKISAELGYHPVLACKGQNWIAKEAIRLGFEVVDLPFKNYVDFKTAYSLLKLILKKDVKLIHTHSSIDSYIASYLAKGVGKKLIRTRHSEFSKRPGHIYRLPDKIITTGERICRQMINSGIPENRVISIPSYPDEKLFSPKPDRRLSQRQSYGLNSEVCVLGTMGGTSDAKQNILIVHLLPELLNHNPQLHLMIAGPSKPQEKSSFEKVIAELGVQSHITLLGNVTAVDFLNILDIYICPSRKEGLPQSLMQAMMMGCAAVSSDVGSIAELNVANNLPLFPSGDIQALTDCLTPLVISSDKRKELGEKNFSIMRRYFSRHIMKEKTEMVYNELIK